MPCSFVSFLGSNTALLHRYATAKSVAEGIYEAAKKKKTKVVLDSTASLGVTVYGLFPGTINSAVKKEVCMFAAGSH